MKQLSWDMNRGCPSAENVFAIGVKLHDNFAPPDFLLVIFPPPTSIDKTFPRITKVSAEKHLQFVTNLASPRLPRFSKFYSSKPVIMLSERPHKYFIHSRCRGKEERRAQYFGQFSSSVSMGPQFLLASAPKRRLPKVNTN